MKVIATIIMILSIPFFILGFGYQVMCGGFYGGRESFDELHKKIQNKL